MNKSPSMPLVVLSKACGLALVSTLAFAAISFSGCTKQAPAVAAKEAAKEVAKEAPKVDAAAVKAEPPTLESQVIGKNEAEVLMVMGHPVSKAIAHGKGIYRWTDTIVTFEDGLAIKLEYRDAAREQANRADSLRAAMLAERREANLSEKQRNEARINEEYMANSRREKDMADRAEADKKEREHYEELRAKELAQQRLDQQNAEQAYNQRRADTLRKY